MPNHPTLPPTAQPSRPHLFDPWNSSSTGHQRSDASIAGTTAWRLSRTRKLNHQYRAAPSRGGGRRIPDLVGPCAPEALPLPGGSRCQLRLEDAFAGQRPLRRDKPTSTPPPAPAAAVTRSDDAKHTSKPKPKPKQIFAGLTVYLSGSTYSSSVSDHRLRRLLATHGARIALGVARREVSHVIVGDAGWAGGGLAAGKVEKEVKGRGIKFVKADWAVESVREGRRLEEWRFAGVKRVGGARQGGVGEVFAKVGKEGGVVG